MTEKTAAPTPLDWRNPEDLARVQEMHKHLHALLDAYDPSDIASRVVELRRIEETHSAFVTALAHALGRPDDDLDKMLERVRRLERLRGTLKVSVDDTGAGIASAIALQHVAEGVIAHVDDDNHLLSQAMNSDAGWATWSPSVLLGMVLRRLRDKTARPPELHRLGIEVSRMIVDVTREHGVKANGRDVVADPQPGDVWRLDSGTRYIVLVVDEQSIALSSVGDPGAGFVVSIRRADILAALYGATFERNLPITPPREGEKISTCAAPVGALVELHGPSRGGWAVRLPDGRGVVRPCPDDTTGARPWAAIAAEQEIASVVISAERAPVGLHLFGLTDVPRLAPHHEVQLHVRSVQRRVVDEFIGREAAREAARK